MDPVLQWLPDPQVFAVNRLPAHSDHVAFASQEECAAGHTSLRQTLNGTWRFAYSPSLQSRPRDFYRPDFDDGSFSPIQVPGHIELQGYGHIQYINTLYPWDGHAPIVPPQIDCEHTAVGSYVCHFDLLSSLRGKSVCISFQGVERAFCVWLNGQFIGYAEDSFTPSEFDLTPYLLPAGNRLCVEVYQHSSASWLEDQDMFRFFGIFRDVYLYAKPELHLNDVWFQAGLEPDNRTGTLRIRLQLEGDLSACRVCCRIDGLYDSELELREEDGYYVSDPLRFEGITPWSHESPCLYPVTLSLFSHKKLQEIVPYRIGFRRFEMKDGILCLNGQRIVFCGVNRHEWNPSCGRAITAEDMTNAISTFKRNNINAVRTCHYPNQTLWYHLCDENGIYMIDETNLETHGTWMQLGKVDPRLNVPGSLPEWKECVLDRARSMLERDKNHPAILLWSCGNESYAGSCILAMTEYFHQTDPSRLVHYEGVFHCREFNDCSDVESRMYDSPAIVREYLENDAAKPFLMCEYMHNMGNSLGGMDSYTRLAEEYDKYQGGFIWDYMDQALWRTDPAGRRTLGYGGDFCDRQSDYNFSANGIVAADGTEKPAMQEVRYQYASKADRQAHDARNHASGLESFFRLQTQQRLALQQASRAPALTVVHGDGALGVRGDHFEILFSKPEGGPVSLVRSGQEWLWRAPRLALWRAATENDTGSRFPHKSSVWQAADCWQICTGMELIQETSHQVCIRYQYEMPAIPGLQAEIVYTVDALGRVLADCSMTPDSSLPELACFGLRFATPVPIDRVVWTGLSGETYPDRKAGGVFGVHQEIPHMANYLVPQECGCHMDTHTAVLKIGSACLEMQTYECPFAFSALPYTPQQIDAACHQEELPLPTRTVVSVYGAMRGVGGINSWHADPEPAYRLPSGQTYHLQFYLVGV